MKTFLVVFLGAGVGGALRHGVNILTLRLTGEAVAYGTLFVNVAGSLLMGVLIEYLALKGHLAEPWRLLLTTGVLGGFTTFSAFSLDAALIYERGQWMLAAGYVLATVALSVGALFAGLFLVRQLVGGSP